MVKNCSDKNKVSPVWTNDFITKRKQCVQRFRVLNILACPRNYKKFEFVGHENRHTK